MIKQKYTKYVWTNKIVLIESKLETKYNKFQHFVAKWLKLTLADTYYHVFRIDYKGQVRIKKDMILMSESNVLFKVIDTRNRQMVLVTIHPQLSRPRLNGKLTIIEKIENNKKQK